MPLQHARANACPMGSQEAGARPQPRPPTCSAERKRVGRPLRCCRRATLSQWLRTSQLNSLPGFGCVGGGAGWVTASDGCVRVKPSFLAPQLPAAVAAQRDSQPAPVGRHTPARLPHLPGPTSGARKGRAWGTTSTTRVKVFSRIMPAGKEGKTQGRQGQRRTVGWRTQRPWPDSSRLHSFSGQGEAKENEAGWRAGARRGRGSPATWRCICTAPYAATAPPRERPKRTTWDRRQEQQDRGAA